MKSLRAIIFAILIISYFACSESIELILDTFSSLPSYDIIARNFLDIENIVLDDSLHEEDIFNWRDVEYQDSYDGIIDSSVDTTDAEYLQDISGDISGEITCPEDMVKAARYMGDLRLIGTESSYLRENCDAVRYSVVVPQGAEFSFFIKGEYLKPLVIISGPGQKRSDIRFEQPQRGLPLIFSFKSDRSGEYFLTLSQVDYKKATPYSITISCVDRCDKISTRYPIIMVHGFSGFKNIGPIEYFYNVPDTLTSLGYDVHIAKLDPYNSIEVRGGQLANFVDEVLLKTDAYKVNIIAHSQGGLDSRYVISALMKAEKIASLITVATPHYGTPLADFILADPTGAGKAAFDAILVVMGAALDSESKANAMASLHSLSVAYITGEFNKKYQDDPGVKYFSYAGKTCRVWENCGDTVDVEISLTYELLRSQVGDNDGIVPTASAMWGNFLGVLPADHFDEVGQVAGVTNENFNHIEFYKSLARLLVDEGF